MQENEPLIICSPQFQFATLLHFLMLKVSRSNQWIRTWRTNKICPKEGQGCRRLGPKSLSCRRPKFQHVLQHWSFHSLVKKLLQKCRACLEALANYFHDNAATSRQRPFVSKIKDISDTIPPYFWNTFSQRTLRRCFGQKRILGILASMMCSEIPSSLKNHYWDSQYLFLIMYYVDVRGIM